MILRLESKIVAQDKIGSKGSRKAIRQPFQLSTDKGVAVNNTLVYKALAKIVGVVLLIVGIGAVFGGNFAHSFVRSQLSDQQISMPTQPAIDAQVKSGSISQEDGDELSKYAGEQMTNGNQALAFANNYVHSHMKGGAIRLGVPEDQATYYGVGEYITEQTNSFIEELKADDPDASDDELSALADKEIANPDTKYESAKKIAALNELREGTLLDGNTIRGMLLNAYGWWLVGTIVLVAGIALIVIGALLTVAGFVVKVKPIESTE